MSLPLSDVRILDLSAIIAGPYSTLLLGDLGAEVIKIEKPGTGDGARGMPPHYFEGESVYFIAFNRGESGPSWIWSRYRTSSSTITGRGSSRSSGSTMKP
jgi:hypothetical protein